MNALCRTRPAEWWETGDDGNRLALLLCSVCPALAGCGSELEYGVIRGGVVWGDDGERLPLCPCGRPVTSRKPRGLCFTCLPSQSTFVPGRLRMRRRRGEVDEYFGQIGEWRAAGVPFAEIARRLRMRKDTVRKAWQARCPQAASTEDAGRFLAPKGDAA